MRLGAFHLPTCQYGLFVDAMSLLVFFTCIGHIEAEKMFSAFYSEQWSGFVSMYEARVVASVRNLFPMVSALSNPDKWENGTTSLKYQLLHCMVDVEYQLESSIDSLLSDYQRLNRLQKNVCLKPNALLWN
jgi:hypothetical protein